MIRYGKTIVGLAGILAVAALAACETPAPAAKLPELTYTHLAAFRLPVQKVEVVNRYVSPMREPNVEHMFPVPPARAMERWGRDRLRADGQRGAAQFVIVEASVKETKLPRDTSFKGMFTKQQSERYDARVDATLDIPDAVGAMKGVANAHASRWVTVREDASLNEREKIKFDLVEGLMKDFDAEMEKSVLRYLGTLPR
ncbi:MAG: hypothetical protein FJX42_00220 [Alphaproteobacteria bacterium]|nr:hypothetical protein [Alphaproteobacteria bacterium]